MAAEQTALSILRLQGGMTEAKLQSELQLKIGEQHPRLIRWKLGRLFLRLTTPDVVTIMEELMRKHPAIERVEEPLIKDGHWTNQTRYVKKAFSDL